MNKYIWSAIILVLVVFLSYVYNFYYVLDYEISDDPSNWALLGDYFGGVLNPLLSFVTLILLVKSLSLQNNANKALREEIDSNERVEKIKSFQSLFFNMISSQKQLFDNFKVERAGVVKVYLSGSEAVRYIEDKLESNKSKPGYVNMSKRLLEKFDEEDQLFGVLRSFYISVRMIDTRLSNKEGFGYSERENHFLTLINFTDFSQVRLVLLCVQFMDNEPARYLREAEEFKLVLKEVGLSVSMY